MANELIRWDVLMRALESVVNTDTFPADRKRNLSNPVLQRRMKSCVKRSVERIANILGSEFKTPEDFDQFTEKALAAEIVIRFTQYTTVAGRTTLHGLLHTTKGFIVYG